MRTRTARMRCGPVDEGGAFDTSYAQRLLWLVASSNGKVTMLDWVASNPLSTESATSRSTAYSATISLVAATRLPFTSTSDRIRSYLYGSAPAAIDWLASALTYCAGSGSAPPGPVTSQRTICTGLTQHPAQPPLAPPLPPVCWVVTIGVLTASTRT